MHAVARMTAPFWVILAVVLLTARLAFGGEKSCAWPEKCDGYTVVSFGASGCQPSALAGDDGYMGMTSGCPELFTNSQPFHVSAPSTLRNLRCDVLDLGTWIAGDGYVFTVWEDANNVSIAPGPFATQLACATSTAVSTANRQCSDLVNKRDINAGAFFNIRILSNNATTPSGSTDFFCTIELHPR